MCVPPLSKPGGPNPDEISAAWDRTADMFARQFPKVKELMDNAKTDVNDALNPCVALWLISVSTGDSFNG